MQVRYFITTGLLEYRPLMMIIFDGNTNTFSRSEIEMYIRYLPSQVLLFISARLFLFSYVQTSSLAPHRRVQMKPI